MDFTFGIITEGHNDNYILSIIDSIKQNNIPNYEIIIVGNTQINDSQIINIPFDESEKSGWITRKKNIIAEVAKYENIVLLHDYIKLNDAWYTGFLQYGNDFDWCVTQIKTIRGNRFRDYTLCPYLYLPPYNLQNLNTIDDYLNHHCLLPYNFINTLKTNKHLYISGSYYIIKKSVALLHQLDETLCWGNGEDLEYAVRLHKNNIIIKCNPLSSVSILKEKIQIYWETQINDEKLNKFINYCENHS